MPATSFVAKVAWKVWRVVLTRDLPKDLDGLCDSPTENGKPRKNKKILIRESLVGQAFMETVIHESLHAALDCLNEEYVEQTAADQAALLCHDEMLKRFLNCPKIHKQVCRLIGVEDPQEIP